MKSPVPVSRPFDSVKRPRFFVRCGLLTVPLLGFACLSVAQVPGPEPTPAAIPTATISPTPAPTATPVPSPTATPNGTPQITITPGVPSAAEMEAYNVARTPQVEVILSAVVSSPGVGTANAASTSPSGTALHPSVRDGVSALVTLRPAASTRGRPSRNPSASASNPQPVATVTLTYPSGNAGQLVWVQMAAPAGVLTATDSEGKTYSGEHGFDLTLDANGQATFTYQPPDFGGTYKILTRLDNVVTVLPFQVPDDAP